MSIENTLIFIVISGCIGYCIPPIVGILMIWIAEIMERSKNDIKDRQ